ncbi:DUF4071 domain-containing protein [Heyndrickxia oleronia]|uniref:TRAFs-binding domain-containing protein n=1 Tax=Heyndrickxia oleronia TaxID=38875 RepID=UPI00203BF56C|nr:TRAFs-binding domain-containing protein [Heyndrickxia oleronia]MCM3239595.1 DUF4071 domain-containing protein [Heyndrickxia oleronia]
MKKQGLCFVIMGYGVKTDYSTGRILDLDKTYKNIIKPVAEKIGLECIRADEIKHSGTIDVPMYNYLINADIVIADLSTYNPNAFYELGVRHALRPYTTIAIGESELKAPFDVNHTVIHKYEHLGKDIGYDEATRFQEELETVIREILDNPATDSPVYTYLPGLESPIFANGIEIDPIETSNETLSTIITEAQEAVEKDDFIAAKSLFQLAHNIDQNNDFVIQKLVLSTYKSEHPDQVSSLQQALKILDLLKPDFSTDPETLGLAGAIYKRLWDKLQERSYLDKSISHYEKGFYIKNDYYNGINLAYLLNVRGSLQTGYDSIADYVLANRIRRQVILICKTLISDSNFQERSDQYWIVATLEEAYFGIGENHEYLAAREQALLLSKENWERKTTDDQLAKLRGLLEISPLSQ